jgi:hypothetical protein
MVTQYTRTTWTAEDRKRVKPINDFLDKLMDRLGAKNDAALCRAMNVAPPVISKLRYGRVPFGPSYIIVAHELTGWSIAEIKKALGLKKVAA